VAVRDHIFLVFDHDGDRLLELAEKSGCSVIRTSKTGDSKDIDAAQQLLGRSDWKVAFLHINPEPWDDVVSNAPKGRVIFRFSGEGFPPRRPLINDAMCIFCNKRIDDIQQDDIDTLMTVLDSDEICENLRKGRIPKSIGHLIAFERPHHLQSLMILIQGILASIAADPEKSGSKEARECLGLSAIPVIPSQVTINKRIIRQALGIQRDCTIQETNEIRKIHLTEMLSTELCTANLNEYSEIASLVKAICLGDDELDSSVAIAAYRALRKILQ